LIPGQRVSALACNPWSSAFNHGFRAHHTAFTTLNPPAVAGCLSPVNQHGNYGSADAMTYVQGTCQVWRTSYVEACFPGTFDCAVSSKTSFGGWYWSQALDPAYRSIIRSAFVWASCENFNAL
jgi:hypothetical protein